MSKKLVGAICACVMMICGGVCTIGYVIGNSNFPWWLFVFGGGVFCAIISMIGGITWEKDKEKKTKKLIGCICASVSMLSVVAFLVLIMLTKVQNSWIVLMVGGITSGVISVLYNAIKGNNK